MDVNEITALSTWVIAVSTFVGVGGSIVFYLRQLTEAGWLDVANAIILYMMFVIVLTFLVGRLIKYGSQ
jgi:type III secretory pathway component EscS